MAVQHKPLQNTHEFYTNNKRERERQYITGQNILLCYFLHVHEYTLGFLLLMKSQEGLR